MDHFCFPLLRCLVALALCLGAAVLPLAQAQAAPDAAAAALYERAQVWLDQMVGNSAGLPLRMAVSWPLANGLSRICRLAHNYGAKPGSGCAAPRGR